MDVAVVPPAVYDLPHSGQTAVFIDTEACKTFPLPFCALSYALFTCSCSCALTAAPEAYGETWEAALKETFSLEPSLYFLLAHVEHSTAPALFKERICASLMPSVCPDLIAETISFLDI